MTSPFAAPLETSLKLPLQGGLMKLESGEIVAPQFHCCISGNTVGVDKNPVAVLTGVQTPCAGIPFVVDFSRSWSPTDTLAGQAYTITWGDGSPNTNGNFPNPRDPASETATKAAGYAVGVYTVQIEIQDSTGANDFDEFQIAVIDCGVIPTYTHALWYADGMMITSDDEFYYTYNLSAAFPTWSAFAGGFPGTEIHDAAVELESDGNEYVYAADFTGIFKHGMPPTIGAWSTLVTAEDMVDAAGLVGADYTCICERLAISYVNDGWQWCSWTAQNPALGTEDYYVGVAHTRDGWQTITHSSVVVTFAYDAAKTQAIQAQGIDIIHRLYGSVVYCAVIWRPDVIGGTEDSRLYRSADYGQTWTLVDSGRTVGPCDVWAPDDYAGQIVWFGTIDEVYKSSNWGLTFVSDPYGAFALSGNSTSLRIAGPRACGWNHACAAINGDELWSHRVGVSTHITPDMPGGDTAQGFIVQSWTCTTGPDSTFWVGGAYLATSRIKINVWPAGSPQVNKEGGYADPDPSNVVLPELREYT